ncbi:MAG TPA: DUF2169 domain-containing protein [Gammaproteobacteria bacterium]|nr:DUF2169 domain-containing protein [Gammaproteobacteria bacterium]
MRVVKPFKQSLLHRTYQYRGENHFCASVFTMFSLSESGKVLPENELWQIVAGALGRDAMLDAAMPKARGEYIVLGSFHAPGGKPVPAGQVEVTLGGLRKRLAVFGNRYWKKAVGVGVGVTDPEPVTDIPLTFAQAFGGPDYKENPLGKGAVAVETETGKRQPLPNLEIPDHLIGSPDDKPPVASFGMIDLTWPQRFRKVGTYDQKWQKERAPGLADDIDWTHFNATAPDQWLEGHFKGDESFSLRNLHPDKPLIEGQLPGLLSRVFITQKLPDGTQQFRELPMQLDTVYFIPDQDVGMIVWRGDGLIGTDDAMDIREIMLAYERLRDPRRSLEHYQEALRKRVALETRSQYLLNEADLIPDGDRSGLVEMIERCGEESPRDGVLEQNFKARAEKEKARVKEKLLALGVKAGQLPAAPADAKPFEINLENLDIGKLTAEAKAHAEQVRQEAVDKARAICQQFGQDFDQLMEKTRSQADLPRFTAGTQIERVRELVARFPALAAKFDTALAGINNELDARIKRANEAFHLGYAMGAHQMISLLPEQRRAGLDALRADILARFRRGESLADRDLAGINLAGEDLSGADFSRAYLEFANFSGARLNGANLSGAILAKADLSATVLDDVDLSGACLGKAILDGAQGNNVKFDRATLSEAQLAGSRFEHASFSETQVLNGNFSACNLHNSRVANVIFHDCDLSGADFEGTEFIKGIFVDGSADRIRLARARGDGMLFVNMQMTGADFTDAELPNLRVVGEVSIKGGNFTHAKLPGSNLRALDLEGARFTGAVLDGCELSDSKLKGASLAGASAVHTLFMRADLESADLASANLMEAMLNKARLVKASLQGSNCYGAEFLGITVGDTRFHDANLKLTKLKDWHP